MNTFLHCPDCKRDAPHEIYPWQSRGGGKFDALSVRCELCDRLVILELRDGIKIEFSGLGVER
jgi:hypothetical protein